jgi:pSer/pThr/pTyr-binding forkhead associated (FHA) protein
MTLATRLGIVEVLDRDGHVRLIVPVTSWPVTIGRAIDCDVVLDDVHAAARHATVTGAGAAVSAGADAGGEAGVGDAGGAAGAGETLTLSAGETVNGVRIGKRRIAAQQSVTLAAGDVFQIGNTRLRVRLASDALAAERPLLPEPRTGLLPLVGMAAALLLWSVAAQWLGSDPGGRYIDYMPLVIGLPIAMVLWAGFWSVGSKLVRHRFDFWRHVRVVLGYSLIMSVMGAALPLAAFMFGWTFFGRIATLVNMALACAMVLAHLVLILPSYRRGLSVTTALVFAAGTSLLFVYNYQKQDRLFSQLYVTTLAPPALRLAPAVETSKFLDEVRALKPVLDAHAKDDDDDSEPWSD